MSDKILSPEKEAEIREKARKSNEAKLAKAKAKAEKAIAAADKAREEAQAIAAIEAEELEKFNKEQAAKESALEQEIKENKENAKILEEAASAVKRAKPPKIGNTNWALKFKNLNAKQIKDYMKNHDSMDYSDYIEGKK